MKGVYVISTEVIFLAVVVTLVFLVYTMAVPVISTMQASAVFDQSKSMMLKLDEAIQQVASQGKGSRTTVYVNLGAGELTVDDDLDVIKWSMQTDSPIVSPRSMQRFGNLIVGANLDVRAYENESQNAYVLENQHLMVFFRRIGGPGNWTTYNTSNVLLGVYNKNLGKWMDLDRLEISIDGSPDSMNGTGYTELVDEGNALPRGQVVMHMNTPYVYLHNYSVTFTLESGADFFIIEGKEQF